MFVTALLTRDDHWRKTAGFGLVVAGGRNVVPNLLSMLGKVNRFVSDDRHHYTRRQKQGYHRWQLRCHRDQGNQADRGYQAIDGEIVGDSPLEGEMAKQIDHHAPIERIEADAGEGSLS